MCHRDLASVLGGHEGRVQRDVLDVAAGDLQLLTEPGEVDVAARRRLGREMRPPDLLPALGVGEREVDQEPDAPSERIVDVFTQVGGEDRYAFIGFHLLEKIARLDIGVAIVSI